MSFAPIALFCYKRPWHLAQTVEALKKNQGSVNTPLIVFADGPKRLEDQEGVDQVRAYLKTIEGFESVTIIESAKNLGLANSIIKGVTYVVEKYGTVIVVEDDIVTSPYFLKFMNEFLEYYKDNDSVISANGFTLPFRRPMKDPFFIKGADCWGWATWKRGWDVFEPDGEKLLQLIESNKLTFEFDYDGTYPFVQMLKDQIAKKNDSWAIRWQAAAFLKDKLTLYPPVSMARNIGFDGTGEHCSETNSFKVSLSKVSISPVVTKIEQSRKGREQMKAFYRVYAAPEKKPVILDFCKRVLRKIKRLLSF